MPPALLEDEKTRGADQADCAYDGAAWAGVPVQKLDPASTTPVRRDLRRSSRLRSVDRSPIQPGFLETHFDQASARHDERSQIDHRIIRASHLCQHSAHSDILRTEFFQRPSPEENWLLFLEDRNEYIVLFFPSISVSGKNKVQISVNFFAKTNKHYSNSLNSFDTFGRKKT